MSRLVVCARCAQEARHYARGLCRYCYEHAKYHGQRGDYPATQRYTGRRDGAALVEDYRFLVATTGATRRQAADRLGVTKKALEKALQRHPQPAREETA